jgi:hypothetical protein
MKLADCLEAFLQKRPVLNNFFLLAGQMVFYGNICKITAFAVSYSIFFGRAKPLSKYIVIDLRRHGLEIWQRDGE